MCVLQDKHCSRDALLAGLKLEEQAQSPNQNASQYVKQSVLISLRLYLVFKYLACRFSIVSLVLNEVVVTL